MKQQKSPHEHLLHGFLPQAALLLAAAAADDDENVLEVKKALQSVDLNQKDRHGKTPLLVALMTGNLVLVKILLDLGANIHCSSRVSLTDSHSLHPPLSYRSMVIPLVTLLPSRATLP